jgi:hypothetical protein
MRLPLLVLLSVCALVAATSAASAPTVVETRSCSQAGPEFNVQIAGNIDGTYWGRMHRDLFARIPRGEAMVAVWTFGSQQNIENDLYGWAAGSRSDLAARCRGVSARAPSTGALRPAIRVEDGWSYGRRYECNRRGRIVIQTDTRGSRIRMSVWMASSRELIAVAEISRGKASVRASKRCDERDL